MIRKIADWISYSPKLNSSSNVSEENYYSVEEPEEFFGAEYIPNCASKSSSDGQTSVLDCHLAPNNSGIRLPEINPGQETCPSDNENSQYFCNEDLDSGGKNRVNGNSSCERSPSRISASMLGQVSSIFSNSDLILDGDRESKSCSTPVMRKSVFTQTDPKPSKAEEAVANGNWNGTCKKTCLSLNEKSARAKPCANSNILLERFLTADAYGILYVVGCNGSVLPHLSGRISNKYMLRKKVKANGLKEAFSFTSLDRPLRIPSSHYVVAYPVSTSSSVFVAFESDGATDMFQVGRYEKPPVDFQVCDVNTFGSVRNGVSRFACRIVVQRSKPHKVKIYAAAFNSSHVIYLGENGISMCRQGKMDGFTTNGVLILHPDSPTGAWRELSVGGYLYPLRSEQVHPSKRARLLEESNVLQDGTLIDLCGITLLWRTPHGLENTPKEEHLLYLQSQYDEAVPERQLLSPRSGIPLLQVTQDSEKKAYAYTSCGHVVGLCLVPPSNSEGWSCPICRCIGPLKELCIGKEPGYFLDRENPSYAFKPCGHAASFRTVKFWSSVKIPDHRNILSGVCPFCGNKLNSRSPYVKLTLPEELNN